MLNVKIKSNRGFLYFFNWTFDPLDKESYFEFKTVNKKNQNFNLE